METAGLSGTLVSDISSASNLKKLKSINVSGSKVDDLSPLSNVTSLIHSEVEEYRGVSWIGCKTRDDYINSISSAKNPDRTVLLINYLRSKQSLDEYWPEWYRGSIDIPRAPPESIEELAGRFDESDLPDQQPAPLQLVVVAGEPIRLRPDTVGDYDRAQAELHEELTYAATALLAACGDDNRRAALGADVQRYVRALGDGLQAVQPRKLWGAGNTLRRLLEADVFARTREDADDPPLPEFASARLADLVDKHNVFSAGDATLLELDNQSLGPIDPAFAQRALDAGEGISRPLLRSPLVIEAEAAGAISEAARNARAAINSDSLNSHRLLRLSIFGLRNAAAALVRAAWLGLRKLSEEGYKRWDQFAGAALPVAGRGVGSGAGLAGAAAVVAFVSGHAPELAALLEGAKGSAAANQLLLKILEALPKG